MDIHLKCGQIYQLVEYTPHLKGLTINIETDGNEDYKSSSLPALINLTIVNCRIYENSMLMSFLQNLRNLRCLYISLDHNLINGHQWEQLIRNDLPKLKVFQLKMQGELSVHQNIEERADELINSLEVHFGQMNINGFCSMFLHVIRLFIFKLYSKTFIISDKNFLTYSDQRILTMTIRSFTTPYQVFIIGNFLIYPFHLTFDCIILIILLWNFLLRVSFEPLFRI